MITTKKQKDVLQMFQEINGINYIKEEEYIKLEVTINKVITIIEQLLIALKEGEVK